MLMPWHDYSGKLSPLKAITLALLFVPGVVNLGEYALGTIGARPIMELIHGAGLWTIRLLFIALAVTPFRQILRLPKLILVRRMIGVSVFVYAAFHFTMYMVDKAFDLSTIAWEIVLRIYLTIGMTALLLLLALAVTSTDGMIRRLGGRRWQRLHQSIYVIGVLATTHYFMQSKLDVTEPTVMAGLFIWLMGYRLIVWYGGQPLATSRRSLAVLGIGAGLLTAFGEAAYFWLVNGIDPTRVLEADLSLDSGLRPGWIVLAAGLAVAAIAALWPLLVKPAPVRSKPRQKPA